MTEAPLRIVLVDDEAPARRRLRELLDDCTGALPLLVVGEGSISLMPRPFQSYVPPNRTPNFLFAPKRCPTVPPNWSTPRPPMIGV